MTVPYNTSAPITYSHLLFDYSSTSPSPIGSTTISWQSSQLLIATVSGNVITAVSATGGDATVTGSVGSLQSGFELGTIVSMMGVRVTVHVPAPPPPSPPGSGFRISAITASSSPFTSVGSQPLAAVVENGGYPVDVLWWTTYSDSAQYNSFYRMSNSVPLNLPVHAGSYNIQVRAAPQNGNGTTGTEFIQNFPVCTGSGGGGGQFIAAREPDAKTGC
jgi:hypothetical protein